MDYINWLRLPTTSAIDLVIRIPLVVLVYIVTLTFYRLCISQLAKIPGPKIAAATGWYEFYFECILGGQYVFEVDRMHKQYGPIVRISPWEVHINDPSFFDQLYSVTAKLDKDHWYYRAFDSSVSGFGTASAELHRIRRGAMNKFFSPASIARLGPLFREIVGKLCFRVEQHKKNGKIVDLSNAYRCLASDLVSKYTIPHGGSLLDDPDFAASYNLVLRDFSYIALWHRQLPFIFPLINLIPRWIIARTQPRAALAVYDDMERNKRQADLVVKSNGDPPVSKPYPVVICGIFNSDIPPSEKTVFRLEKEIFTILGAGTETTGNTLTTTTYHLLANPSKTERLRAELMTVPVDSPSDIISYRQLESLPYLNACINEGLRLASPVSGRMPRVNPYSPIRYESHIIPPGTPVSMCQRDLHYNSDIYSNPHEFNPERWLDRDAKRQLDRYFVPFSKGSRGCVGMNFAMANTLMVIGNLFRRFRMKLHETTVEDVAMAHDLFAPFPPIDSKGLRVIVD